jgi:hypothetical protein
MSWGSTSQETAWDFTKYANYAKWRSDNVYTPNSGTYVIPLAVEVPTSQAELRDFTPVATVQAHAPYTLRTMTFNTRKRGTPPVIPSPESTGAFTFLNGSIHFDGPSINQSLSSYDWEVSGAYLFIQNTRFSPDDGFVLTGTPFPLATQTQNKLQYQAKDPQVGPVSEAGLDAQTGYAQGQQIDLRSPYWRYNTITFYPAQLLNADLANGGLPAV